MTPQEKAKELMDKYINLVPKEFNGMDINLAKQCALIVVDEIISEYSVLVIETAFCGKQYLYWKQVKQEIKKL